jgi:hypothetical protein
MCGLFAYLSKVLNEKYIDVSVHEMQSQLIIIKCMKLFQFCLCLNEHSSERPKNDLKGY